MAPPPATIPALDMLSGDVRWPARLLDAVLSIAMLIACGIYVYVAIGAVYGGRQARRTLESLALTVGAAAIVLGYRFALLLLTLYTA